VLDLSSKVIGELLAGGQAAERFHCQICLRKGISGQTYSPGYSPHHGSILRAKHLLLRHDSGVMGREGRASPTVAELEEQVQHQRQKARSSRARWLKEVAPPETPSA
jgi:hypothetical protein